MCRGGVRGRGACACTGRVCEGECKGCEDVLGQERVVRVCVCGRESV